MLFDQAFRIFFRKRAYLDRLIAMMMPQVTARRRRTNEPQAAQRVHDALFPARRRSSARSPRSRSMRA